MREFTPVISADGLRGTVLTHLLPNDQKQPPLSVVTKWTVRSARLVVLSAARMTPIASSSALTIAMKSGRGRPWYCSIRAAGACTGE